MPEITDEENRILRNSTEVLNQLLRSPKTKRETERLIKTLHPDATTSEDHLAPVLDEVRAVGKKVDDFLTKTETDKQDSEFNAAIGRLRTAGYTDEGIEKIKQLMKDRLIPDVEAAAALFDKTTTKPMTPSGFQPTNWGFGAPTEDKDLGLLFKDEDAWAEKEAQRAWTESQQIKT